jgi:hypothetical protein
MPRKRRFYRQRMPRRTERTNRVSGRALRPAAAVHGLKARADPPQPACPRRGLIPTQAGRSNPRKNNFLNVLSVDGQISVF